MRMEKKTVVMLGGYGQNFLRPFSLVTYYYYILKFNLANGQLESVEKKLIYDRTILINTKDCSKNLGIIKTVNRVKNDRNEITIENEAKLT